MYELTVTHNAGFFSCCSMRLLSICTFFENHKRGPKSIDGIWQFRMYKSAKNYDDGKDVSSMYFADITNDDLVLLNWRRGHFRYHAANSAYTKELSRVTPFLKKYFEPSTLVKNVLADFELLYNIDYSNTIGVYYRGNDKWMETQIAPYQVFLDKAGEILNKNPTAKFLIQTDEEEFLNAFFNRFPANSFCDKTLPCMPRTPHHSVQHLIDRSDRPMFAARLMSGVLALSKCNWLITATGNCALWSVLYRGSNYNVHQYLRGEWISNDLC